MPFWNFAVNQQTEDVELRITGDIVMEDDFWSWLFGGESTTPKGFRKELEKHKGKDITVWINSTGGDVYAASSIYTSLKEHKGKVAVKIDGYACSAASVIAMAGDEILMSPTSIMMIHNPWGAFQGEASDMRHAANVLDEVKDTILNAYSLKTKKPRNKISKMMDDETWMGAKTAVNEGFADGILYQEEGEKVENSFMFSRLAIQNNTTDSFKRFIEQYNKRLEELKPENKNKNDGGEPNNKGSFLVSPKEEPRPAPVDLYKNKLKSIERTGKSYDL
jgi:ATP-dependent Clp protease protease subunit